MATYYVRQDGSAANKAAAVGPSTDASKCMDVAKHNAETFAADDIILFSDKSAAAYSGGIIPPSSGDANHPIILDKVPGESPLLTSAGQNEITINGKSNITIQNLSIGSSSVLTYCAGIYIHGTADGITIKDCTITMPTNGYYVVSDATSTGVIIDGGTFTGATNHPFCVWGVTTGLTIKNITFTGGLSIRLTGCVGVTILNVIRTASISTTGDLALTTCTGVLSVDNFQTTTAGAVGILLTTCTFDATSVIENCIITNAVTNGISLVTVAGPLAINTNTITGCSQGILLNASHDITITGNTVSNSDTTTGCELAGICYNITYTNNTSSGNNTGGFYITGSSHEVVYTGNTASGNTAHGWYFSSTAYNITYTGNTASTNTLNGYVGSGDGYNVTYTGNISSGNVRDGFIVNGSNRNIHYTDNQAIGNGSGGSYNGFEIAGTAHGIYFDGNISDGNNYDGWQLGGSCYNIVFHNNLSKNNVRCGFRSITSVYNVWHIGDIAEYNASVSGFYELNDCYNFHYKQCISRYNGGDGFAAGDQSHDIAYDGCYSHHNGDKATVSEGDGFTAHTTNYNTNYFNCIAAYNTAAGFALVGTSAGVVYHCVAYKNAGNWLASGEGIGQERGGFDILTTGANATSGVGWVVQNCIGQGNYPREINLAAASVVTFDYNIYKPLNDALFASLDSASTNISWDTYHASYETNSQNIDPLLNIACVPSVTSPVIDAGTPLGVFRDFDNHVRYGRVDIGARMPVIRTARV